MDMQTKKAVTINDFYVRLSQKVSDYNARLLLHTAVLKSGLKEEHDAPLKSEDVKTICLALIGQGGPAFHVGRDIYQQIS
jgi:hypothetical protein